MKLMIQVLKFITKASVRPDDSPASVKTYNYKELITTASIRQDDHNGPRGNET
jgi:hypothetical protein